MVCVKSWKSCFCFIALLRWHDAEALTAARNGGPSGRSLHDGVSLCAARALACAQGSRWVARTTQRRRCFEDFYRLPHNVDDAIVRRANICLVRILGRMGPRFAFYER